MYRIKIYMHYYTKYTHVIKKIVIDGEVVSELNEDLPAPTTSLKPLVSHVGEKALLITSRDYGEETREVIEIKDIRKTSYGYEMELEKI